jgi:hypothetical protein
MLFRQCKWAGMKDLVWATLSNPLWSSLALSLKAKSNTVLVRGGFGSDRLGIGQNRCSSVENKFTDNPSVDRFGSVRLVEQVWWVDVRRVVRFNWAYKWTFLGLQVDFKNSVHIIVLDFFGPF